MFKSSLPEEDMFGPAKGIFFGMIFGIIIWGIIIFGYLGIKNMINDSQAESKMVDDSSITINGDLPLR